MKVIRRIHPVGYLILFLIPSAYTHEKPQPPLAAITSNSSGASLNPVAAENQGEYAELFDPKNGTWQPAGLHATKRETHSVVALDNGDIFVLRAEVRVNGAEIYSAEKNSWKLTADPLFPVNNPVAIRLADQRILVLGPETSRLGPTEQDRNRAQIYDPKQNSWSLTSLSKLERQEPSALILQSGEVLVVGGRISSFKKSDLTETYTPGANLWQEGMRLKIERDLVKLVLLSDGKVLAVGGTNDPRTEIFDPKIRSWTMSTPVSVPRVRMHSLTRLKDGKILLIGGVGLDNTAIKVVEKFDPTFGKWTTVAPAPVSLYMHSAVQLDDGRVMVVGGYHDEKPDASVLLYDPTTDKWSTQSKMKGWESNRTFTKLKDGRVLAVGGYQLFNPQSQIAAENKSPFPQEQGIRLVEATSDSGCSADTYLIAPNAVDEKGKQVVIYTLNFLYSVKDIFPGFSSKSSTGVTVEPKDLEEKIKDPLYRQVLGPDLVSAVLELLEARKAFYKTADHLPATWQEFVETPEYRRHLKAQQKVDEIIVKKFNLVKVDTGVNCD